MVANLTLTWRKITHAMRYFSANLVFNSIINIILGVMDSQGCLVKQHRLRRGVLNGTRIQKWGLRGLIIMLRIKWSEALPGLLLIATNQSFAFVF